jgi:uncharacterized protein with NRDE domain
MCTLVARFDPDAPTPLVIAANRDERLDRPAGPPRLWDGPTPFLAPVDLQAGGSWLGLNANGLFVGITNRFGVARDPARGSRGQLVTDALAAASAAALHDRMGRLDPLAFNAFHLFYADARSAHVTWTDGAQRFQETLTPGLHVITERSLGGDDRTRSERARDFWREHVAPAGETPQSLESLMRLHTDGDPLGSLCVHAPAFHYGTRSSFLLWLSPKLASSRIVWSPAAPCRSDYGSRDSELERLVQQG